MRRSPDAASELIDAIEGGEITATSYEADDYMGATDCPEGCQVEPDGYCSHDYMSAALSAGII